MIREFLAWAWKVLTCARRSGLRATMPLFLVHKSGICASTKPVAPVAKVRVKVRYSTQVVARGKVDLYHGKVEVVK